MEYVGRDVDVRPINVQLLYPVKLLNSRLFSEQDLLRLNALMGDAP